MDKDVLLGINFIKRSRRRAVKVVRIGCRDDVRVVSKIRIGQGIGQIAVRHHGRRVRVES